MLSFKNTVVWSILIIFLLFFSSCAKRDSEFILHGKKRIDYLREVEKDYSISGRARMKNGFHGWWNLNVKDGEGLFFIKGPLGIGSRRFQIKNGKIEYRGYSFDTSLIFLGIVRDNDIEGLFVGPDMMPDSLIYRDVRIKWLDYKLYKRVYVPSVIMVIYWNDTVMVYVEDINAKG